MSAERDELIRLIDELPDREVPQVDLSTFKSKIRIDLKRTIWARHP